MYNYSVINRQKGAALIIGLIMLATATIVGVAGVMASLTEERIAGNHRQIAEAFMSAETGISDGYAQVVSTEVDFELPKAEDWKAGYWKPRGDANEGKPEATNPLQDCIMDYGLREEENGEWIQKESDRIICAARLKDQNNPQAGYIIRVRGNDGINASGSNGNGNWKIEHLNFVYAVKQNGDYVKKIPNPDPNETPPELVVTHETPNAVQIATMRVTGTIDGTKRTIEVNLESNSSNNPGFPPPEAAYTCYGVHCTTATGSNSNSSIYFDGRDWNLPASDSCTGAGCNGSLVGGGAGTTGIYLIGNDASDAISTGNQGGDSREDQIQGYPPRKQTDASISEGEISVSDWNNYISNVLNSTNPVPAIVDASTTNQILSSEFGSRNNPSILHITGSGNIQMSGNTHGAGVMIIDGPISVSPANGTATFEGLIILRNGATFASGNGTFNVFGSIIALDGVAGTADASFGGNFSLKYSSQALDNINHLGGGSGGGGNGDHVAILSWQEIQ